jgi:hypothetical protein
MEYFLGLLTAVVFFVVTFFFFYMGYKQGKKTSVPIPLDKEKKRQMEQFDKGFKEIFSYDVEKALQKKKVT